MDIVESVSPTMPANMEEEESEDEDEKMRRYKEAVKNKVISTTNLLCIWDCANIWLYISEGLAIVVFDPFTACLARLSGGFLKGDSLICLPRLIRYRFSWRSAEAG